jgi:inorganic pyrophosphatase
VEVEVVIEIPQGPRNKYEMDHATGRIRLDRMLSPRRATRWTTASSRTRPPGHLRAEIGHFFDIYQELEPGKSTDVRGWQDRVAAERVIDDAIVRARHYESDGTSRPR